MTETFVTKEICRERHDSTAKEFGQIRTQISRHTEKIQDADVRFAELSGDVKYIKNRIDNGLSTAVNEIKKKMDEYAPLIKDSVEWADKFKQAVLYLAVTCFGGGIVSLIFLVVRKFAGAAG